MNDKKPDDVIAYEQGLKFLRDGKFEEAIDKFRFAAIAGEDRAMEHYTLAVALMRKKEYAAALSELKKYLALDPPHDNFYSGAKNTIAKLEAALKGASQEKKSEAPGEKEYEEGLDAYLRGDLLEAGKLFLKAKDAGLRHSALYNAFGSLLLDQKKYVKSRTVLLAGLEIDPLNSQCLINLATAQLKAGQQEALKSLESALEIDNKNIDALYNMAMLQLKLGKKSKARHYMQQAAELAPQDKQIRKKLSELN